MATADHDDVEGFRKMHGILYRRMPLIRTTLLGIVLTAVGLSPSQAAPPALISVQLSPCELEPKAGVTSLAAECGSLSVPEDPGTPGGRRISIAVARVPAVNRRKLADPLIVLAGGPGQAATDFYGGAQAAFARIQRDRDIVLVDQRGTGGSNALNCEELNDEAAWELDDAALERETRKCVEQLSQHADLRFYTTSVAIADLELVRAALGYERVNLYGVSYGTRVAQHYVRRFPQRVRSVILDGVVPVGDFLGPTMAIDAEKALAQIFARCVQDADCERQFGDPAEDYRALRTAVSAAPVEVSLDDPATGAPKSMQFSMLQLATVLRISSYNATQAALLPLSLHLARRDGNFRPLAAQFLQITESLAQQISYGMHNSVVCTEDVPFYDARKIDRRALEKTYLGTTQLDGLIGACKVWPRGILDPDLHAPLRSTVPALLLSGGSDPATPKENGIETVRNFADGVHVIVADQGHGQLAAPCVDAIMARFITRGTTRGLDVSCTKQIRAAPFFLTLAGPAP
jgi:pimeloyl-ACP methyl ester carboxylesterase